MFSNPIIVKTHNQLFIVHIETKDGQANAVERIMAIEAPAEINRDDHWPEWTEFRDVTADESFHNMLVLGCFSKNSEMDEDFAEYPFVLRIHQGKFPNTDLQAPQLLQRIDRNVNGSSVTFTHQKFPNLDAKKIFSQGKLKAIDLSINDFDVTEAQEAMRHQLFLQWKFNLENDTKPFIDFNRDGAIFKLQDDDQFIQIKLKFQENIESKLIDFKKETQKSSTAPKVSYSEILEILLFGVRPDDESELKHEATVVRADYVLTDKGTELSVEERSIRINLLMMELLLARSQDDDDMTASRIIQKYIQEQILVLKQDHQPHQVYSAHYLSSYNAANLMKMILLLKDTENRAGFLDQLKEIRFTGDFIDAYPFSNEDKEFLKVHFTPEIHEDQAPKKDQAEIILPHNPLPEEEEEVKGFFEFEEDDNEREWLQIKSNFQDNLDKILNYFKNLSRESLPEMNASYAKLLEIMLFGLQNEHPNVLHAKAAEVHDHCILNAQNGHSKINKNLLMMELLQERTEHAEDKTASLAIQRYIQEEIDGLLNNPRLNYVYAHVNTDATDAAKLITMILLLKDSEAKQYYLNQLMKFQFHPDYIAIYPFSKEQKQFLNAQFSTEAHEENSLKQAEFKCIENHISFSNYCLLKTSPLGALMIAQILRLKKIIEIENVYPSIQHGVAEKLKDLGETLEELFPAEEKHPLIPETLNKFLHHALFNPQNPGLYQAFAQHRLWNFGSNLPAKSILQLNFAYIRQELAGLAIGDENENFIKALDDSLVRLEKASHSYWPWNYGSQAKLHRILTAIIDLKSNHLENFAAGKLRDEVNNKDSELYKSLNMNRLFFYRSETTTLQNLRPRLGAP